MPSPLPVLLLSFIFLLNKDRSWASLAFIVSKLVCFLMHFLIQLMMQWWIKNLHEEMEMEIEKRGNA